MAHARRSLRNHHGKPHEHAPGDPLGVYLPPLEKWPVKGREYAWKHPSLPLVFYVKASRHPNRTEFVVRWTNISDPNLAGFAPEFLARGYAADTEEAYALLKKWYAGAEVFRQDGQTHVRSHNRVSRRSERNPDWSAIRAKASHYGSRAAAGAREAYEWTAPRAKRAAEVTWEGAKSAGRAVKRGAKRAAPVVARGARSAAEGMERWAQTNGRCAMLNGTAQGRTIRVGNKRLGGHILRYSGHYGDAASRTGLAFYKREAIPLQDVRDALQDLKWMAGFDTLHGRAWQRGEKSVLATTIKGLESVIARAK